MRRKAGLPRRPRDAKSERPPARPPAQDTFVRGTKLKELKAARAESPLAADQLVLAARGRLRNFVLPLQPLGEYAYMSRTAMSDRRSELTKEAVTGDMFVIGDSLG